MWELTTPEPERWRLSNRTGGPVHQVVVTFNGVNQGKGWVKTVPVVPDELAAGAAIEISIVQAERVDSVEVEWRAAGGEPKSWTWTPGGFPHTRMAVLPLDSETVLPMPYHHDRGRFQTLGYLRVGGLMVTRVEHEAADTDAGRDEFLVKVLMSLMVPERRFREILRKTEHLA